MENLTYLRRRIRDLENEPEKALPFMEQAAELGDYPSICSVIHAYTYGDMGFKPNPQKVFRFTLMGAEQGIGWCQFNAAVFYRDGTGCERDLDKSTYWMIQAAQGDESRAYLPAAEVTAREGDYGQARSFCKKALDTDRHDQAVKLLGRLYEEEGVMWREKGDHVLAAACFEQGAELDSAACCVALAYEYSLADGVGQDLKKTYEYSLKAADLGEPAGMYNVSMCLREGAGCTADDREAFEWMKNAANIRFEQAYLPLAQHYLYGVGVRSDRAQAERWGRLALKAEPDNQVVQKFMKEISGI